MFAPAAIVPYGAHWAIEEAYAAQALELLGGMDTQSLARQFADTFNVEARATGSSSKRDERPYTVEDGVAILSIQGPLTKQMTCMSWWLGGTSTVAARQTLRQMSKDAEVASILVYLDTPGGQVAGTGDLASEVARTRAVKPVWGYASDLCASAGYWIGSQCERLYANETALVGSIGTYMVVQDTSAIAKSAGVKVHVIRAGEMKGAGMSGTPITDAHLADFQRTVNALNAEFLAGVAKGRGMTAEQVQTIADGRIHVGAAAQSLGLVDGIAALEDVIAQMQAQQTLHAAW